MSGSSATAERPGEPPGDAGLAKSSDSGDGGGGDTPASASTSTILGGTTRGLRGSEAEPGVVAEAVASMLFPVVAAADGGTPSGPAPLPSPSSSMGSSSRASVASTLGNRCRASGPALNPPALGSSASRASSATRETTVALAAASPAAADEEPSAGSEEEASSLRVSLAVDEDAAPFTPLAAVASVGVPAGSRGSRWTFMPELMGSCS